MRDNGETSEKRRNERKRVKEKLEGKKEKLQKRGKPQVEQKGKTGKRR